MIIVYRIGQFSSQNAYSSVNYADGYSFFPQGTGGVIPPPPTNTAIIQGLSLLQLGLTLLSGLTTNLYRGVVEDDLNNIPKT